MKKSTALILTVSILFALTPQQKQKALKIADTASKAYLDYLEKDILKILKQHSLPDAFLFCKKRAYSLSMKFALKMGRKFKTKIKIKRISFKNRNPSNAPDEIDAEVLKKLKFVNKPIIKEYNSFVRVYEPIYMKELCLMCHGKSISPLIQKEIKKLYPNDKAVGYKKGDFRGAVVVTIDKKGLK